MDVLILDDQIRPIDIVDEYISLVWTERWDEMGDFELVTLSPPTTKIAFSRMCRFAFRNLDIS